jgi:exosome complex RNA-binding protein Csl4
MQASEVEVVCPGQRIGNAGEYESGAGTYVRGGRIYSTLVGIKTVRAAAAAPGDAEGEGEGNESSAKRPALCVQPVGETPLVVPEVGNIVTCRVRTCMCVLCVCWGV